MPVQREGVIEEPVPQMPEMVYGPHVVPMDDRDELEELVRDAIALIRRVGGVVMIAGQRREVAPGVVLTTEVVWKYDSFAPTVAPTNGASGPAAEAAEAEQPAADEPSTAAIE
jgi:hypothetical protein